MSKKSKRESKLASLIDSLHSMSRDREQQVQEAAEQQEAAASQEAIIEEGADTQKVVDDDMIADGDDIIDDSLMEELTDEELAMLEDIPDDFEDIAEDMADLGIVSDAVDVDSEADSEADTEANEDDLASDELIITKAGKTTFDADLLAIVDDEEDEPEIRHSSVVTGPIMAAVVAAGGTAGSAVPGSIDSILDDEDDDGDDVAAPEGDIAMLSDVYKVDYDLTAEQSIASEPSAEAQIEAMEEAAEKSSDEIEEYDRETIRSHAASILERGMRRIELLERTMTADEDVVPSASVASAQIHPVVIETTEEAVEGVEEVAEDAHEIALDAPVIPAECDDALAADEGIEYGESIEHDGVIENIGGFDAAPVAPMGVIEEAETDVIDDVDVADAAEGTEDIETVEEAVEDAFEEDDFEDVDIISSPSFDTASEAELDADSHEADDRDTDEIAEASEVAETATEPDFAIEPACDSMSSMVDGFAVQDIAKSISEVDETESDDDDIEESVGAEETADMDSVSTTRSDDKADGERETIEEVKESTDGAENAGAEDSEVTEDAEISKETEVADAEPELRDSTFDIDGCLCAADADEVFKDVPLPESVTEIIGSRDDLEEDARDVAVVSQDEPYGDEPEDAIDAMLIDIDEIAETEEEKAMLGGDDGAIPLMAREVVADENDSDGLAKALFRRTGDSLVPEEDRERFPKSRHVIKESGVGESETNCNDNPVPVIPIPDGQVYTSERFEDDLREAQMTMRVEEGIREEGTIGADKPAEITEKAAYIPPKDVIAPRERKHSVMPRSTSTRHGAAKLANIIAIYDKKDVEIKLGDKMAYGTPYDFLGEVVGIGNNCFFTVHMEEGAEGPTYVADQWILDDGKDGGFYHYVEDSLERIIGDVMDETISLEELAGRFREVSKRMRAQKGISHQNYLRSLRQ